jgi:hypothetical protein
MRSSNKVRRTINGAMSRIGAMAIQEPSAPREETVDQHGPGGQSHTRGEPYQAENLQWERYGRGPVQPPDVEASEQQLHKHEQVQSAH